MTRPQFVSASTAQLDELVGLAKTRTAFSAEQYGLLEQVLDTFVHVMLALQNAKTSIKRFRQMLFGVRTERMGAVFMDGVLQPIAAAGRSRQRTPNPARCSGWIRKTPAARSTHA